jgi:hypothetical protein
MATVRIVSSTEYVPSVHPKNISPILCVSQSSRSHLYNGKSRALVRIDSRTLLVMQVNYRLPPSQLYLV